MSVKEFWEDDPDLFWAYRFSYLERKKRERDFQNEQAWLQGAYFFEAVSVALSNAFSKEKHSYREKPYNLYEQEETPKQTKINTLEEQIKARAKQIEKMLGDKKDGKEITNNSNSQSTTSE